MRHDFVKILNQRATLPLFIPGPWDDAHFTEVVETHWGWGCRENVPTNESAEYPIFLYFSLRQGIARRDGLAPDWLH